MLRQRCPRCRRGPVYRTRSAINVRCPDCGLLFEREEGYFLGAMYISYGMACLIVAAAYWGTVGLFPEWPAWCAPLVAVAILVPLVPVVTRYARVFWLYFDYWAWPGAS
jgi:uncharacterized protein (DUF983 family)